MSLTHLFYYKIFINNMDKNILVFTEKLLNTDSMLNYLGKDLIDRFEVEMTSLPEDIKSKVKKQGWNKIEDLMVITMYLNTDKEYISCDDLYYAYNIDTAWWEHNIIPNKVLKYMGITKDEWDFKPHVIVKSKNGEYTYCSEDISQYV